MDLRVERTRRHIAEAFLALRAQKPLERMTVKELAARAEINKATFYLHYRDIYDLADRMEAEIVEGVMGRIHRPEDLLLHPSEAIREMTLAFQEEQERIRVVFSGSQREHLVERVSRSIRQVIFAKYPQWRGNLKAEIIVDYCIYGSYYACAGHLSSGLEEVVPTLCQITDGIRDLFLAEAQMIEGRRDPEVPPAEERAAQA